MHWQIKALIIVLFFSFTAHAQNGAPPYFTTNNSLKNVDVLTTLAERVRAVTDSGANLKILHLGDSHVKSGFFSQPFADSVNRYFSQLTGRTDAVQLLVLAKNGATSKHFLEAPYNATAVQEFQPDIIIVSLGTNEAQNLYTIADLQHYFSMLLTQIRADAPNSYIFFTTPGDALRKTNRVVKKKRKYYTVASYSTNNVLPTVVDFIKVFAEENNAAYWDWYNVMGGRGAMARWLGHGYANTDKIHLIERGYNLQGWLLATAFVNYFKTLTADL